MKKFASIKAKYLAQGITEDNIDYAIGAVIDGTQRAFIIESLTADYRGMTETAATELLEELFEANGGEFKKENRGGYLFGTLLCLVGLTSVCFLIAMIVTGEWKSKFVTIAVGGTLFGFATGPSLILKSIKGKFRESDDPFRE